MTTSLKKNIFREIRGTWKRFLSIALMAFLGAGFFAGINAASRDMQLSCDTYLDAQNCFDLEVLSTLGLTDADVTALLDVDGISAAEGVYSENVRVDIGDGDEKVKLLSIPQNSAVNQLYVLDGTLPTQADECAVPQSLLDITGKQLGDTLTITETLEQDEDSSFVYTDLRITAVIQSPLYVYADSGTNERSTGAVADYLYVPACNILEDYFTEIYLTVDGAAQKDSFGDDYDRLIDDAEVRVKAIADTRENARYVQLTGDAQEEIDDAQAELDETTADARQKIADAQAEIDDAQRKLDEGREELDQSRAVAERKFREAEEQINRAESQLADAYAAFRTQSAAAQKTKKELKQTRAETEQTLQDLADKRTETQNTIDYLRTQREPLAQAVEQYQAALDQLADGIAQAQTAREQLLLAGLPTEQIDAQLSQLLAQQSTAAEAQSGYELQLNELDAGLTQAEDGILQIDDGISQAKAGLSQIDDGISQIDSGLASGRSQLAQAENSLSSAKRQLANSKTDTYSQLSEAERKLVDGQAEIDDGIAELSTKRADFDEQIADAQQKLDDAREAVADINPPTWYVLTRDGNSGLSSFIQDSDNLKRIGFTFPLIFFLVAVLISLSSMTRMVEEQRGLIGTLGALGYSGGQIAAKYLIYAAAASILGSIFGELVCFRILPRIIWDIYQSFYQVPEFYTPINRLYGAIGLLVCVGCIVFATGAACWQEIRHTPAHLMRPKAPDPGKRVFIEYITPIWSRCNFSQKVTLRNLFRYKKRFFMTICGIAGCAALVTTGFGLRDSLSLLLPLQYDTVMHYDMIAVADSNLSSSEFDELSEELEQSDNTADCLAVHAESVKLVTEDGNSKELELFVPSDLQAFTGYISLLDSQTDRELIQDDTLFLTEQLAEQLNISAGDTISVRREDGTRADCTVGAIVHNYLSHYAFLSPQGYQALYGETADNNAFFLHTADLSDSDSDAFAATLNRDTRFSAVSSTRTAREAAHNKLSLLNQVVFVLIAAAAALAIVVLYNLSNINISERIRELATIKVLGFYDMEVYQYNGRETVLLTLMGTVLGLIGGRWLTAFILLTMEMQGIVLVPTVAPISYVISAVLTIAFASIINFMTYFSLKKINMVEALKSVE